MANKRTLKKRIRQLCGEAAIDVLLNLPLADAKKYVVELARLQSRQLSNVTFNFDHVCRDFSNRKEYKRAKHVYNKKAYLQLKHDFNNGLLRIVNDINKSLTQEQREANKLALEEQNK